MAHVGDVYVQREMAGRQTVHPHGVIKIARRFAVDGVNIELTEVAPPFGFRGGDRRRDALRLFQYVGRKPVRDVVLANDGLDIDSEIVRMPQHLHDAAHYYLGAKYFDELGYENLYTAMLRAELETSPGTMSPREVRDLSNNELVPMRVLLLRSDAVKAAFTPERWEDWKKDVAVFRDQLGPQFPSLYIDHGFEQGKDGEVHAGLVRPLVHEPPPYQDWFGHRMALFLRFARANGEICPDKTCRREGICQRKPLACQLKRRAKGFDFNQGWHRRIERQRRELLAAGEALPEGVEVSDAPVDTRLPTPDT